MARLVTAYQGQRIEIVREGKRGGWRYSVKSGPDKSRKGLAEVGPFETTAAAYQHAVRHLNLLADEDSDRAVRR